MGISDYCWMGINQINLKARLKMSVFRHNDCDYPAYKPPDDSYLLKNLNLVIDSFSMGFQELGLDKNEYYVDALLVTVALIRTDQRKLHYLMYHNGMEMNELKWIAVLSYWMLRFKPINRIAGGPIDINEQVILCWVFRAIRNYRQKSSKPVVNVSERLKRDLLYAFTYRDISYDYMTILVESLAE